MTRIWGDILGSERCITEKKSGQIAYCHKPHIIIISITLSLQF